MKTKIRKPISLMLSLALLIGSVSGITFHADASAETAEKIIVYVAAEGTNASGASVTIDKTPVLLTTDSTAEDAIRTVLDSSIYKDNYVITANTWGASLDAIGELAQTADYSAYWNFCVNGDMAPVGIGSYELEDQDQISLLYGGFPLDTLECGCYQNDTSLEPDFDTQDALLENAKAQQALLAEKIYEANLADGAYVPGIEDTSGLYVVFFLARSGFEAEEYYTAVVNKILAQYTAIQENGSTYGTVYDAEITAEYLDTNPYAISNYCKTALCLAALGQDITNVAGFNLAEKITNRNVYSAATSDNTLSRETLILFTMDGTGAEWPETPDTVSRAELINTLVSDIDEKVATCISWNSYDYAAMVIQALSSYIDMADPDIDTDTVTMKCDQVIGLLSNIQSTDGSYISYGASNPWTLAQVMTTVGLYGINPLDDSRFIKNGRTLFDISATFVDTKKQWIDPQLIGGEYAFQPEQLLAGLTSCIRSAEQDDTLFDLTMPLQVVTPLDPETMQIIHTNMVTPIADQAYTGNPVTPQVTVTANQTTLIEGTDYTVSYLENTEIGTAYAIITGKGNWMETSIKIPFQIVNLQKPGGNQPQQPTNPGSNPSQGSNNQSGSQQTGNTQTSNRQTTVTLAKPVIKKLASSKKKTLTVSFGKVKKAKKYKIQIATNKKFKKNAKTKTVTSAKKVTFQKLQSGKKYYVRICAINGKKQSKWSKVKSIKVK
ncbi:MAG: DUF4430 domain-containing protein [Lachnospiraceae bacterium]|nr:DUF4430 domain-containing protein [Lachnospiraceae bacterium]